jgi:phosphopantothenoylcysteine decarboxylase / phosphopantothenate---cysteine ligase
VAQGMANDLLTTLCLATQSPIFIAPAMNPLMWSNPATQANVALLQQRQVQFLGPASGEHACGEEGLGRMLEPSEIVQSLLRTQTLSNHHVLITAGPTQEAIDPVRFLSNRSSGKMGFALAEAAYRAGAKVTVVAGPTSLALSPQIQRINVTSANQMLNAVLQHSPAATIFIAAAAVSDYQVQEPSEENIKKQGYKLNLSLTPTPDILQTVTEYLHLFTVGFALETQHLLENAEIKLRNKKVDMIVANELSGETGFNTDTNAVHVLYANGKKEKFPLMSKNHLASVLVSRIAEQVSTQRSAIPEMTL